MSPEAISARSFESAECRCPVLLLKGPAPSRPINQQILHTNKNIISPLYQNIIQTLLAFMRCKL